MYTPFLIIKTAVILVVGSSKEHKHDMVWKSFTPMQLDDGGKLPIQESVHDFHLWSLIVASHSSGWSIHRSQHQWTQSVDTQKQTITHETKNMHSINILYIQIIWYMCVYKYINIYIYKCKCLTYDGLWILRLSYIRPETSTARHHFSPFSPRHPTWEFYIAQRTFRCHNLQGLFQPQ